MNAFDNRMAYAWPPCGFRTIVKGSIMRVYWVFIEGSEGLGPTNPQPTPYQPPMKPL